MTTPEYNPNIPQPKDIFSSSSLPFLENFLDLYNAFNLDHVALDAVANAGNHNLLEMLEQNKTQQFQTDVGEISLYSKKVDGQTDQIYLRFQGNQDEFQYSNYQIYPLFDTTNPPTDSLPYITFLPNNILVYFGLFQFTGSPSTFTFNPPIAKNIIGMNFCVVGSTPGYSPSIQVVVSNGFSKELQLSLPRTAGGPTIPYQYSYFIAVNL